MGQDLRKAVDFSQTRTAVPTDPSDPLLALALLSSCIGLAVSRATIRQRASSSIYSTRSRYHKQADLLWDALVASRRARDPGLVRPGARRGALLPTRALQMITMLTWTTASHIVRSRRAQKVAASPQGRAAAASVNVLLLLVGRQRPSPRRCCVRAVAGGVAEATKAQQTILEGFVLAQEGALAASDADASPVELGGEAAYAVARRQASRALRRRLRERAPSREQSQRCSVRSSPWATRRSRHSCSRM